MLLSNRAGELLFDLLVHAAWADRRIGLHELGIARAAARVLHPGGEEGARGKLALGPDASLTQIAHGLSRQESALGFALALWLVLADGVETPRESAMLDEFRLVAGLSRGVTSKVRQVVRRARTMEEGPPWDAQLRFLLKVTNESLPARLS